VAANGKVVLGGAFLFVWRDSRRTIELYLKSDRAMRLERESP
jgi:hypothetical protein